MPNAIFDEVIGQDSVKAVLSMYIDAYAKTGRLPFLMMDTGRGGGKTYLTRLFRSALRRPNGSKIPFLEVNCATIKSMNQFFEQVVPLWVGKDAFLFLDELHNLPKDLQQLFLTILEVSPEAQRTVEVGGTPHTFDFSRICFCGATTNPEALSEPLRDRLRPISFEEYTPEQLFEIFHKNLNFMDISPEACALIKSSFRGNPRDAVVKAEELKTFLAAKNANKLSLPVWEDFCKTTGINPFGLSHSEIRLIKILGVRKEATLTVLASVSGMDRGAIQKNHEQMLFRKGLMEVDGKRRLTALGTHFYHTFCKA